MKNRKNKKQNGFIALFFILGISFTFLTWISLSSERVFEYLYIKEDFLKNREKLHNYVLCADYFINIILESRNNVNFIDNKYIFTRNVNFIDNYECYIKDINIVNENEENKKIFFIYDDFGFEYKLEKGFVNFNKSFNLF